MAFLYERDTTNAAQMVNDVERSIFFDVNFRIEPFKGKANCYTIYKPHKVSRLHLEDPISDPHRLNHKYQEMLHGWRAERRQRETGAYDMYYYHKGKQYRSIPDVQKYLFNGCLMLKVDEETNEVKEVGAIEKRSMKRKGSQASNGGCDAVKEFVVDGKNNLNWCWQRSLRSPWIQKIMGGLVGDNTGGASNVGDLVGDKSGGASTSEFGAGMKNDEGHISDTNGGGSGGGKDNGRI